MTTRDRNSSGSPPLAFALWGVTKRYGDRPAVDDLTVEVPVGAVVGFVGPNGSGKTTTMAMLLGLLRPNAGTGEVLGAPLAEPARYLHRVGALIETPAMYPALTGRRNLEVLATVAGHDRARIPEVLELVGLSERADDRFRTYSLGMKQRLGVAAALLGDPALLILDEPTNGLDPAGIHEMRSLIGRLAVAGRTLFVSSHVLAELEQVCDWLVVIEAGRLRYAGPAEAFAPDVARLRVVPERPEDAARLATVLVGQGFAARVDDAADGAIEVRLEAGGPAAGDDARSVGAQVNRAAAAVGIVVGELCVVRTNLEERYLELVSGGGR